MPTLFPEDYEKFSKLNKKRLAKQLNITNELSALEIALNAHTILNYLKQQGAEKPNGAFVKVFQYASAALGVPYEVIDEAFFTQTPLTEQALFDVSYLFNPNAKVPEEKELPVIPITIDFYSICLSLFDRWPSSFWQPYLKKETLLPETKIESYNLESLLQGVVQAIWLETKNKLEKTDESELEKVRQMFLAYFYRNNQKYYRKKNQEMLLELLEKNLQKQPPENFNVDKKLMSLLKEGNPKEIYSFVIDHLYDWTYDKNYQRFLRSVSKTKNLSLVNQLLLLYQRAEALETKEVNAWIRENRTLKEEAKPIFLFGEKQQMVHSETGKILKEKRTVLDENNEFPIVPYFEKSDTEGRDEIEKIELIPKKVFEILEKLVPVSIVFEEREMSVIENHTIRLKAKQSEEQTIADLIFYILEKEKQSSEAFLKFENENIASIIMMVFGLNPLPLDLTDLTNLRNLKNGKVKLQHLFTNLIIRSELFLQKFWAHMYEKEPNQVRPILEEEIKNAKELQRNAMGNVATEQTNKADSLSMEEMLEKTKASSEGNEDDQED